jgi:putative redox protein
VSNTARLELQTIEQGLRFSVLAGSGQTSVIDSGTGMQAPSPVEMLLASLAACHAMDIISILRKKRQQVTAYRVEAEGDRREEHPKAYSAIRIMHRFEGRELSPIAIEEAIRLTETRYCSVRFSLDPAIEVSSRYEIVSA